MNNQNSTIQRYFLNTGQINVCLWQCTVHKHKYYDESEESGLEVNIEMSVSSIEYRNKSQQETPNESLQT